MTSRAPRFSDPADFVRPACHTSSAELRDAQLLRRLAHGDVTALKNLIDAYWVPLLEYATRVLQQPDAAEDIAQETFVRIWEGRGEWRPEGSLCGYLYRMARNLAFNERRRVRIRAKWAIQLHEDHRNSAESTPADQLEDSEIAQAVEEAITRLPERRRQIFCLARFHGMKYHEIAVVMGLSPQTVANQMTNALADLHRMLAVFLPDAL
jgi:RNA polymerase sigma-70 factor (ECF subfamily)